MVCLPGQDLVHEMGLLQHQGSSVACAQASAHEARDDLLDAATDFLVRFSILGAEAKCAMRDAGAHLTALQCLSLADVTPKQAEALYVLLINQTPHLAMQDLKVRPHFIGFMLFAEADAESI